MAPITNHGRLSVEQYNTKQNTRFQTMFSLLLLGIFFLIIMKVPNMKEKEKEKEKSQTCNPPPR